MYDPVEDPLCPIIKLGTIVKEAGEDYKTLSYKVSFNPNHHHHILIIYPWILE